MVGERLRSREKGQEGREEVLRPGFEILGEKENIDTAIASETDTALETLTAVEIKSIDFCPG